MPITVKCSNPACGRIIRARDEHAGRQGKCPACGAVVHIPAAEAAANVQDEDVMAYLSEAGQPPTAAEPARITAEDTKTCPFCAETIKAAAVKCKHCGSSLGDAAPTQARIQEAPGAMAGRSLTVRASRWGEVFGGTIVGIFYPKAAKVTSEGIATTAVRSVLMPWAMENEKMPWSKVASYRHVRGVFWDRVVIETSGGSNDLTIQGLRKSDAARLVAALDSRLQQVGGSA